MSTSNLRRTRSRSRARNILDTRQSSLNGFGEQRTSAEGYGEISTNNIRQNAGSSTAEPQPNQPINTAVQTTSTDRDQPVTLNLRIRPTANTLEGATNLQIETDPFALPVSSINLSPQQSVFGNQLQPPLWNVAPNNEANVQPETTTIVQDDILGTNNGSGENEIAPSIDVEQNHNGQEELVTISDAESQLHVCDNSTHDSFEDHGFQVVSSQMNTASEIATEDEQSRLFDYFVNEDIQELWKEYQDPTDIFDQERDDLTTTANVTGEASHDSQPRRLPGWKYDDGSTKIRVNVDDVDEKLSSIYVQEVKLIVQNTLTRILQSRGEKVDGTFIDPTKVRFTMMDFISVFLPTSLLQYISENANRVLCESGKDLTNPRELLGIVFLHVLSASYHVSAQTICRKKNAGCYVELGIEYRRYLDVWSALAGTSGKNLRNSDSSSWTLKPKSNSFILAIEQQIAAINTSLLFVENSTICSLDDDHLRMRSRSVPALTNLQSVNNPVKSLGPVNNAICSALTSVYLVGHFTRVGDGIMDIWTRLIMLLQGEATPSSVRPMSDTVFASDRAYNNQQTIKFINEKLGATGLGTHKRTNQFPFIWGDVILAQHHQGKVVSEKGCRSIYSAERTQQPRHGRKEEAIVYRESFSGRVAALYHNNKQLFSSKKFTIVPREKYRGSFSLQKIEKEQIIFKPCNCDVDEDCEHGCSHPVMIQVNANLENITIMTYYQSEDPVWFLTRAFAFTSRTSISFLRTIQKDSKRRTEALLDYFNSTDGNETLLNNINLFPVPCEDKKQYMLQQWKIISECIGIREQEIETFDIRKLRQEICDINPQNAKHKTMETLRHLLTLSGRKPTGRLRKAILVQQVLKLKEDIFSGNALSDEQVAEIQSNHIRESVPRDIKKETKMALYSSSLETWLMKPLVTTPGMRDGSANESHVLNKFKMFVQNNDVTVHPEKLSLDTFENQQQSRTQCSFSVQYLRTFGLIARKDNSKFCNSPDGYCCLTDSNGESILAPLEN